MDKQPNSPLFHSDPFGLKFKSTPELVAELKQLVQQAGSIEHPIMDRILMELQLRGQNDEGAALIASIDQQRKKIAEDTAEMTEILNKRELRLKSELQEKLDKIEAMAKRTEELMEKQNQLFREATKSRPENTGQ